ncbi:hypothetical protein [Pseudomonas sp. URMO17WK12:I4]|uniref:hypothetical protein n=1 Tax=Pseudomonas sp. URMO17WK12:I4 TaxID=1283292 RepID=UPI0004895595|nr:hypothetical protein [Pseudomonas sp. URMO17WK12:I4]
MIKVNRAMAEEAVRNRLRAERAAPLLELDTAYIRALEVGAATGGIVEQKQALRDVTEKSLSALTLEQLGGLSLEAALSLEPVGGGN